MKTTELLRLGATAVLVGFVVSRIPLDSHDPLFGFADERRNIIAILSGLSPYTGSVPRPPSAWPVELLIAWVNPEMAARVFGAAAIVAVSWLACRLAGQDLWVPVVALIVASTPMARLVVTKGNLSSVVAVLVVYGWATRQGWAVGVAGALRLYPMIFAFPYRRWSPWLVAAGLGVIGLVMVPELGVGDMLANTDEWVGHGGNTSAYRYLGWGVAGIAGGVAVLAVRADFDRGMCLAAFAAATVPALAWSHYHLVLVPAVGWAVGQRRWWVLLAVPFWFSGFGVFDLGTSYLMAALIVLSAVWHKEKSPPEPPKRNRGASRFCKVAGHSVTSA